LNLRSKQDSWGIVAPGTAADLNGSAPWIDCLAVSDGYFQALEIPLLRGRTFTPPESDQGAAQVILSEKLAKRLWPAVDPIGKTLRLETAISEMPWLTVIGIVRDAQGSFASVGTETLGVYVPFGLMRLGDGSLSREGGNRDGRYTSLRFYARTSGNPKNLAAATRTAIINVDRQQPIFMIRTMEDKLYEEGAPRRAMAFLIGIFAFVALFLASVGTYGVMAYNVSERTSEIGIRMALGAQRRDVVALVMKQAMYMLVIGIPLGVCGALMLSGVLRSQLFGVSARDPLTFVSVSLLLMIVTLLATFLPARRATNVDPIVALRYE
jgi:putative ABC transport system permease protein